jgi:excisionase family DNA binding protein
MHHAVPQELRKDEPMSEPRISYSVPEAAKAAGIGLTKLREEIRSQRLVARKLGKRTLINVDDLNAWAANLPRVAVRTAA